MKQQNITAIFLFMLTLNEFPSAAIAGDEARLGKEFYVSGKLIESEIHLLKAIKANPRDADSHYLLGNVYLQKHQIIEAVAEYKLSSSIDTTSKAAQYSVEALNTLVNTRRLPARSDDKADLKSRGPLDSEDINLQSAPYKAEYDRRVKTITSEGEAKVSKLEQEMKEKIAANGSPAYTNSRGNVYAYYDPETENAVVRQEYAPKIEIAKAEINRRLNEAAASYKEKTSALTSATASFQLNRANRGGSARLSKQGNTVYTKSYETDDEVTGTDQLPIKLAPAKPLNSTTQKGIPGKSW